jgi:hypothetical protein
VTVLLIETLFLMDATLLATECVTTEVGLGVAVAVALSALAGAKLAVVRRLAPEPLSGWAAWWLGLQAVAVLALPGKAALLAAARVLDARLLYALWWLALVLPPVRRALLASTRTADEESLGVALWSWVPAASVLIHLWSVGWIHQVAFHPRPSSLRSSSASPSPPERARSTAGSSCPAWHSSLALRRTRPWAFPSPGARCSRPSASTRWPRPRPGSSWPTGTATPGS